jgi:pimeloyl-ACP methyl ester carboxylesterase
MARALSKRLPRRDIELSGLNELEGSEPLIVFLPGWASDCRIFRDISFPGQCIYADPGVNAGDISNLVMTIRDAGRPAILFGWSLGGMTAARIASLYPDLTRGVILSGIRPSFPESAISSLRLAIRRDRRAALIDFYRQCFLPAQKDEYRWFTRDLMPTYLEEMDAGLLESSLDVLGNGKISRETIASLPALLGHGRKDIVAPVEEAAALAGGMPNVRVCFMENYGHAAFLSPEFLELARRWISSILHM